MKTYRQGDILLTEIAEIPAGAVQMPRDPKFGCIVAEGERTGHHHHFMGAETVLFRHEGRIFLSIGKDDEMQHDEHAPIAVGGGTKLEATQQREHRPEARPVRTGD